MILVVTNKNQDYFHIVGLNGEYGTVELVDGLYHAEHYDESIKNQPAFDNELWDEAGMYEDGHYKTKEEAILAVISGLELNHNYLSYLISSKDALSNNDWLVVVCSCEDDEIDEKIQNFLNETENEKWFARAKEYVREAEYFELYEPERLDEIHNCYDRATYLDFLGEKTNG